MKSELPVHQSALRGAERGYAGNVKQTHELLGRRIRQLRTERGMSREALASFGGIGEEMLGKVERGEKQPSLSVLLDLALGLRVDYYQLFVFPEVNLLHSVLDLFRHVTRPRVKDIATAVESILGVTLERRDVAANE